jgi:hypothetical protein
VTRARLVVETVGEEVEADFDVTDPDKPVTIVIAHNEVKIHTADEPKVSRT